jgi:hypothetical protein
MEAAADAQRKVNEARREEQHTAEMRILASGANVLDAFAKRMQTAERLDALREAYFASVLGTPKDPPSNL